MAGSPSQFHRRIRGAKQMLPASVSFAISGDMLTSEEIEAIKKGDMAIDQGKLMNLNAKHPTLKTGERVALFQGRNTKIQVNRLMGLPDDHDLGI